MKWVWCGVLMMMMGTISVSGSPLVRAGTIARPSPTILSWLMAQWVAPIQGEIYSVYDWHVHLMQFTLEEWAQWMSSRPDAQYTASEWLAFWRDPANRFEHPLEETLAYLNEQLLLSIFRMATRAAVQNHRRELRRSRDQR